MLSKSLPLITVGNIEYAERVANVLGSAFAVDALSRAAILFRDSLPNHAEIPLERRIEHLASNIRNRANAGAHLVEAGDWAAVPVW